MNIQTNSWHLNRRTFLRGLGATLALPLLEAMIPPASRAAATAAAGNAARPRRMACIYNPNGVNVWKWFPSGTGREFALSPTLKPLDPLRGQFSVLTGLHHPKSTGGHTCANFWLTGADLNPNGATGGRNTISADQLVAETTALQTRFGSLELSAAGGTGGHDRARTLAWTRSGVPLPSEPSPRTAFLRLFGAESGSDVSTRQRAQQQRISMLDRVQSQAQRLGAQLGQADRRRLDEYLTSVREVEKRVERAQASLDVPKPQVDGKLFATDVRPIETEIYVRTMYELMLLAFQTDSTRVITFMTGAEGGGITLPDRGIKQNHHALSHHSHDPESLAQLAALDTFLVEQFAWFLGRLKETKEADGNLLDSTMLLYGSGMSNAHSTLNLPILLAGGQALGLRHGQHLDFSVGGVKKTVDRNNDVLVNSNARLSNLLLTMTQRMGIETATFGDSVRPVSELVA